MTLDPFPLKGVCDLCGSELLSDSGWRWNGESWEHKCPHYHAQAGHCGQLISHEHAKCLGRIKTLEMALKEIQDLCHLPGTPKTSETVTLAEQYLARIEWIVKHTLADEDREPDEP